MFRQNANQNMNQSIKKEEKNDKATKSNKKYKLKKNNNSNLHWIISVFIFTFFLSLFFSYFSSESVKKISLVPAILILISIIFIGIIFDIIGVAVTIAEEAHFNAKATKKVKSAKFALKLIRNSNKVASFCADVIGDISGVLSGSISAILAIKISQVYNIDTNLEFIISALVASLTVGGKAIGKTFAINNSTEIIYLVSKFIVFFKKIFHKQDKKNSI